MAKIKIELTKSTIGATPNQKKVAEALGLTKMHKIVELEDTPSTRGSIKKICHLVTVTE